VPSGEKSDGRRKKPRRPKQEEAMAKLGLWLIALVAALSACATTSGSDSGGPVYYVMRHLNTPAGERDPDLTEEGRRAADQLAGWFHTDRPAAIYVSDYRRTRQTAAPLAARLGLTPIVYDPADTPRLVARVRTGPLPALVIGHSNTVPEVIAALGGTPPAPLVHEDFGDIWRIGPGGATARMRIEAQ
jgi:phosphohistidine phosphatase SixA